MANNFVYNELHSTDVKQSKSFFSELFDWTLEDVDMGEMPYTFIKTGQDQAGGGIMSQIQEGAPSMFLTYIEVDNLSESTEKAKELGGSVMVANQMAGDYGSFSVVQDPTGAVFAMWESAKKE